VKGKIIFSQNSTKIQGKRPKASGEGKLHSNFHRAMDRKGHPVRSMWHSALVVLTHMDNKKPAPLRPGL